jgi:TPR repeat protein
LKAARKGHGEASFNVAYYYENGIGTDRDLKSAKKWYQRAVKYGDKDAGEALLRLEKPPGMAA